MTGELVKNSEARNIPMNEIERMGKAIAASGLFGIKTQEQAIALMLVAQSEGRHPATVAREYDIIQGRPAIKAEAKLARFQEAGGVIEWEEMTDNRCAARFHHPLFCPKPVLVEWTIGQARAAELTSKDNWKKYPRAMLRSRVISEGVRAVAPGSSLGMYTPEEVQDFDEPAPKNVTPPKAFKQLPPPPPPPEPPQEAAQETEAFIAEQPEEPSPKPPLTPEEIAERTGGEVLPKGQKEARMSSENQQKCIHAMAKSLGLTREQLEADLLSACGTPHTKELTFKQASAYIDALKRMLGEHNK